MNAARRQQECRGEAVPDDTALTKCSWLGCENSLGPNTEWKGNLNFANGKISLLWSYLLFCKLFPVVGLCMWALNIFLIFILCVWVSHFMYVGAPCVCLVPRRPEEGGFPGTGVTDGYKRLVGAGNWTEASAKVVTALHYWAISLAPDILIFAITLSLYLVSQKLMKWQCYIEQKKP